MTCWQLHLQQYMSLRQPTIKKENIAYLQQQTNAWRQAMVACFNTSISTLSGVTLKAHCPNFEAEFHWGRLITFLGPPLQQSTREMENHHGVMKDCQTRTNLIQLERDTLKIVRFYYH